MNRIITIGREFGSGGRELGRRLAEILGYAYYDQEIVSQIANRTQLSEQYVHQIIERRPFESFPIHIGGTFQSLPYTLLEQNSSIIREQSNIIQEMADESDCVIVGRCADYILRDKKPFRIFVYADLESKMERCRNRGGDGMSDKELRKHIADVDKQRSRYYSMYTDRKWGDKAHYDLLVNTSGVSVKFLSRVLADFYREYIGEQG